MSGNKKIIFAFMVILLIGVSLVLSCLQEDGYEKIEKLEDIPYKIAEELRSTELKQGIYVFTANFAEELHIAVCGDSDKYSSYDVEFIEFNREYDWEEIKVFRQLNSADYNIDIKVKDTSQVDYLYEFSAPLVLFKLKQPDKSYWNDIKVFHNGELLKINQWWGNNAIYGEKKDFTFEIIEDIEDIPQEISQKINNMKFDETDHKRLYVFTRPYVLDDDDDLFGYIIPEGSFYDGFEQYMLIHGDKNDTEEFKLVFEDVKMSFDDFYGIYNMYLRSIKGEGNYSYTKGFEKPFVIVKVADKLGNPNPRYMIPQMTILNEQYVSGSGYKRVYVVYP